MKEISSRSAQVTMGFPLRLSVVALQATLAVGCLGDPLEEPTTPENTQSAALSSTAAAPAAVASQHGALKVVGNQIQDEHGATVQLKGMSMFWSQWSGQFWNASVVNSLADDWHATVVRAAMGVENGGYLDNPTAEKARVKTVVDAAIQKGIYVIIDWHDHNATQHTQQAKAFFTEMAQTYGNKPNVLFEVFNEPDNESWPQVKAYAEDVIGSIRGAGASNVVIVGTPTWSQDVDQAADNPITRFQNVAYTLHFYAGTHKQALRDKASYALSHGIALFVTEWGTCDASGNGGLDLNESQTWINFLNQNNLSFANWSLFDKPETASALVPGASTTGGWPDSVLTASGQFVKQKIREDLPNPSGAIALRAEVDNQFVCAEDGGQSALISNRDAASSWEQFDFIKNSDGTVSFRAKANGKFVCAENAGQDPLVANRDAIGDWEKFFVIENGDGTVSFKAKANGKFVCAENAGQSALIANRDTIGAWEKFRIIQQ